MHMNTEKAVISRKTTASKKAQWKQLNGRQKIQFIWDYYKFPIVVCLIFIYIIGYNIYGHFSKKDSLLYTALVNVSISEQLDTQISDGFMDYIDADTSKNEVQLYKGLYLTSNQDNPNHEYTYASRIKIIASIDNEELDIVLMNKEAFDAFSQNGYLCNLEELLQDSAPDAFTRLKPFLATNVSIIEDNSDDLMLDDSLTYQAVTEEYPMGLDVSRKGLFKEAGFEEPVYLGVIANSPRMDMAVEYINFIIRTGYF